MTDGKNEHEAKSCITELNILDSNIFDGNCKYIIPRYQRAYAWEDQEIVQLIDDIKDIDDNTSRYYIGSLVVAKNSEKNEYEVVDGQQRLTTLFLLLNYLGLYKDDSKDNNKQQNLSFAFRDKSNYTLKNIQNIVSKITQDDGYEKNWNFDEENLEQSIYNGIKIISDKFRNETIDPNTFISKLKKVVLFRIEVPEHTDLNRYFEIMNTRGEQLEQVDILKATLMSKLDKKYHELFAKIWNACSDMSDYVQMGFTPKERDVLFTKNWKNFPQEELTLSELLSKLNNNDTKNESTETQEFTWENITNDKDNDSTETNDDTSSSKKLTVYESIIDFPYFLLHTLRVYVTHNKIDVKEDGLQKLLDDKKLLSDFDTVLDIGDDNYQEDFAAKFIIFLLQTRYLFDCYIIKREKSDDKNEGQWSLKYFTKSGDSSYSLTNTLFNKNKEHKKTYQNRNRECLMIESALRVSYTSPKNMHWITDTLEWWWNHNFEEEYLFPRYVETIAARNAANEINKFRNHEEDWLKLGVRTPHILFNVLDYILWKEDQNRDFSFEFRNSVEHFYPQHPSEGSIHKWENADNCVDMFGNLCIVSRKVNSKFSNLSPTSKWDTYKDTISKGSLKLRLMADLAIAYNREQEEKGKIPYDQEYLNGYITMCQEHQEDMERKLNDFINETLS